MKKTSKVVRGLLEKLNRGRGTHPLRIMYALCTYPLQYRTFGNQKLEGELNDENIESRFGGLYMLMFLCAAVVNRYLHASGSYQTFYADEYLTRYFDRHGILKCHFWDEVDSDTLSREITLSNYDHRWAYSACKPPAISAEIKRSLAQAERGGTSPLPIVFHDTDMVLRASVDTLLHIADVNDVPFGYSHLEAVGKTPFYPEFSALSLPDRFTLCGNRLLDRKTNYSYRTDLDAVNTCLLYFSPDGFAMAEEFAKLFKGLMKGNFLTDYDWLRGEQNLLAFDQRTALMVCDRLGMEATPVMPIFWDGSSFFSIGASPSEKVVWPYYHPEYRPELYRKLKTDGCAVYQDIHHLWNQKGDVEKHQAYANYTALILLELMRELCPRVGLEWELLEEAFSTFPTLRVYMELFRSPLTIEELLALPEDRRPVSDTLIKDLSKPLEAPSLC